MSPNLPFSPRAGVLLLLLASCAPGEAPVPAAALQEPDAPDALQRTGWWAGVEAGLIADAHAWRAEGDGLRAATPGHGLNSVVRADGVTIDARGERLRVRFEAWGREGEPLYVEDAAPALGDCLANGALDARGDCVRRVELAHDGVTEWWVNGDAGLEQGWTIDAPVDGDGPLALAVAVEGAALELSADGETIWLNTPGGEAVSWSGLAAWDAAGEPLDARLDVVDDQMLVLVDDADALYPITVDPVYSTATTTFTGSSGSYFGISVAGAGDVDGDGYGDVIVGAYAVSSSTGAAYLYRGTATGPSSTASTTLTGAGTSYSFGYSVAGAGDVNGDGYDDVVVGAPAYSTDTGRVYVYQGSSGGLSTTATTTLTGSTSKIFFGGRVAGIGDANGDGYDDVAVGIPYAVSNTGQVSVYHGSSAGLSTGASVTLTGPTSGAYFGWALAGGDVNGDGYADLLIGGYAYSAYTGYAALYRGSASGISSGASTTFTGSTATYFSYALALADLNGDGYDDAAIGSYQYSSSTGKVDWYRGSSTGLSSSSSGTLTGSSTSYKFGWSVANAGDVNSDGYEDLIIGAPAYSSNLGRFQLHPGSSSGPASTATSSINGTTSSMQLGYAVAGAGDVNGDGYDDVIVGAPYYSSNTGYAAVYEGYADNDGDGASNLTDCDDSDSSVYPGASEYCDSKDNDCDGDVDELGAVDAETFYLDNDGDGFGISGATYTACTPLSGYVSGSDLGFDCDDTRSDTNPGATEVPDSGNDEDCDGEEVCFLDSDGDGYRGDASSTVTSDDFDCTDPGEAATADPDGDCDDDDPDVNPAATEIVGNAVDDDCDGEEICYVDADGDRYRSDDGATVVSSDSDCSDAGEARSSAPDGDCDDDDPDLSPGEGEVVGDGIDQDCDGVDACFADADGDGYRPSAGTVIDSNDLDCEDSGEATSADPTGDCDDADSAVSPGATEVCDGVDNDCNGLTDYVIPTSGPGAFYEISVCDDTDNDGLLDYTERTVTLTDPYLDDTDEDGVDDGVECGLSEPEDPDATTGSFTADDDPSTTTDPLNPDSDDDGLDDGEEDRNGNGAVDSGETDPNNPDSDGGGASDGKEHRVGTDPLDPSDDEEAGQDLPDTGGPDGDSGQADTGEEKEGGCGCATTQRSPSGLWALIGLSGLALRRSRRRP